MYFSYIEINIELGMWLNDGALAWHAQGLNSSTSTSVSIHVYTHMYRYIPVYRQAYMMFMYTKETI
jgi:hypothetical protein